MVKKIIIAITGASGILYALRLIEVLKLNHYWIGLIVSEAAIKTMKLECDISKIKKIFAKVNYFYDNNDIAAGPASGSSSFDAMVIVPCSANTVGALSSGLSNTLITRTAFVAQKEKRQVVIVPRETPLTSSFLKRLYDLASSGFDICPAMPAFYHKPAKIEDLVDFMVFKITKLIKIETNLIPEWDKSQ